ncbi:Transcription termination/antitermination protein NusA [Geodia barretti]|uniref:Transcription termination/antitermination protein NusA n=1 Tax=Geodia barretti TaxID=519541 RepID=A0AA35SRN5_GEOBA|nr:Transcription termination/antitermination protein NusA [Geodia barretti]
MKSDFIVALTQLAAERGLPKETVLSAIEDALVSAYRKDSIADGQNITVKLDPGSGDVTVNILKTVVDDVINDKAEITLPDAQEIVQDAEIGDVITTESLPHIPGRIAAQTAKQVVMQRLRDAEREIVFKQFEDKEGEVFLVTLQKIEPRHITVDLGRSEAIMPISEQVPSERYRSNTKMRVLLKSVERTLRGPELIVSRADNTLLRRLFEMEVPEIFTGAVEIEAIAREPGSRSKVAVRARQDGVDPVGSCVGLRGVRIQNIVNELHGEKIDVVEWNKEVPIFIANALSPAQVMKVELNLDDGTAMAVVPDRQLSLAIGREGQNARLAARLTGWKVDIKSDVEYQVEFQERTRLQEEARAAAAAIAAAEAEIEEAQAAAAVAAEEVAVEPESAPSDVEVEAEPVPIAAEVDQMAETIVADSVAVEAIADEAIAVGLTEVVEDAVPVAAELQPVDAAVTDDAVETELAEPVAEVEVVAEPEAAVEAVEPLPIPEPVLESVQAAKEEQVTSLRDLPEDIWQVRRARVRRPVQSDADAPGRIRFAEDIAGLRGGVTASRRGRRRDDPQAPRRSKCKCTRRWRKAA